MTRVRSSILRSALLLTIFVGGAFGLTVADAVMFHRLSLVMASGEIPAVGDGAGVLSHATCVLEHPLPAGQRAAPPCEAPALAAAAPVAGSAPAVPAVRPPTPVSSRHSRAPPAVLL